MECKSKGKVNFCRCLASIKIIFALTENYKNIGVNRLFYSLITVVGIFIILPRCNNRPDKKYNVVKKLYNNKDTLIKVFENKTLYIRNDAMILKIQTDIKENVFYFKRVNLSSDIRRCDLIDYKLNDTAAIRLLKNFSFDQLSDTVRFKAYIEMEVGGYLELMQQYSINEITSEFKNQGIALKFYLSDNTSVSYVKSPTSLNNSWKDYIAKANKIDSNWYYYFNETFNQ